jgi:methyltransferase (TIGR00027 family)
VKKSGRIVFGLGLTLATALRATEAFRPEHERIYDASFDYRMLPIMWRVLMLPGIRHAITALMAKIEIGTAGMLLCRTRFIDDALVASLDRGVKQVVSLGAGFDTRAYRIPGVQQTQFFELDLPTPQELKREHMQKVLRSIPTHVTFVPIDFDRQNIEDEMAAAGFQNGVQTFFIWEGVTQYITGEAVGATLNFAASAALGSQIAFTYIHRGIIDGSARSEIDQKIISRVDRRGMSWIFGLDPAEIERRLARRGFRLVDHVDASQYRARYLTPVERQMTVYEGERMVLAEVIGGLS